MADIAIQGEVVQFTYKGVVFKVIPEKKHSKLEKLVGQPVAAEGVEFEHASKEMLSEMEAGWMADWSDL